MAHRPHGYEGNSSPLHREQVWPFSERTVLPLCLLREQRGLPPATGKIKDRGEALSRAGNGGSEARSEVRGLELIIT